MTKSEKKKKRPEDKASVATEPATTPPATPKKGEAETKTAKVSETPVTDIVSIREKDRRDVETQVETEAPSAEVPPLPPAGPEAEKKEEKTPSPEEQASTLKEPEKQPEPPAEPSDDEEPAGDEDVTEKLKAKIQKRINREFAKRKSAEEELAEAKQEIARLKQSAQKPSTAEEEGEPDEPLKESKGEAKDPSDAQIKSALRKAREDGDVDFEMEIMDYIAKRNAKRERLEAMKEVTSNNSKALERKRQWSELVFDYTVFGEDGKESKDHPMNLNNQNSKLYKTAQALYRDKQLRTARYSRGSEMENLRRAVSDAYLELTRMGENEPSRSAPAEKLEPGKSVKARQKAALTEPEQAAPDETEEAAAPSRSVTDTEKVEDEVTRRLKFRREREAVLL